DPPHESLDQVGLTSVTALLDLDCLAAAGRIANRDQEDPMTIRIEARRLEVELQPAEILEREIAEVGPSGRDEILLVGREREHGIAREISEPMGWLPRSLTHAAQDRCREGPAIGPAHQVAEGSGTRKLAIGDRCVRSAGRA